MGRLSGLAWPWRRIERRQKAFNRLKAAQAVEPLAAPVKLQAGRFSLAFGSSTPRWHRRPGGHAERGLRLYAPSASNRVSPAAASSTVPSLSPSGNSPSSVAMPRAICSSCSRSGSSCSTTTMSFSSSIGTCTSGLRITMNVRDALPALICWARAWTISAEDRNRWKLTSTRMAELSADARALTARMAASGSLPPASAGLPVGLAGELQAPFDVEDGQPPVLVAAHLGDLGQGIVMFVRFDPEAGETGGNVLGQTLRE